MARRLDWRKARWPEGYIPWYERAREIEAKSSDVDDMDEVLRKLQGRPSASMEAAIMVRSKAKLKREKRKHTKRRNKVKAEWLAQNERVGIKSRRLPKSPGRKIKTHRPGCRTLF